MICVKSKNSPTHHLYPRKRRPPPRFLDPDCFFGVILNSALAESACLFPFLFCIIASHFYCSDTIMTKTPKHRKRKDIRHWKNVLILISFQCGHPFCSSGAARWTKTSHATTTAFFLTSVFSSFFPFPFRILPSVPFRCKKSPVAQSVRVVKNWHTVVIFVQREQSTPSWILHRLRAFF